MSALMRFISRRGKPRLIRCDNATYFHGTENFLRDTVNSLENERIQASLLKQGIDFLYSPPLALHMSGVWERQIRSVWKVLNSLLREQTLTDESLLTLFCQVEHILNSRPLTRVSNDIQDYEALTPNHLLLLRQNVGLPVGKTSSQDQYCRKRWWHILYLSDLFWKRWTREYLVTLQSRSKWTGDLPGKFKVGDLVLVVN